MGEGTKWKILRMLLIVAFCLGDCFFVGQQLNAGKREIPANQESSDGAAEVTESDNGVSQPSLGLEIKEFENSERTEDNPWNVTAGVVTTDDLGEVVLLNPATAAIIDALPNQKICLDYCIHPWVRDSSDGTYLIVQCLDGESAILKQEEYFVANSDTWKSITVDYADASTIRISCDNKEGSLNCDWLIVKGTMEASEAGSASATKEDKGNFVLTYADSVPSIVDMEGILASIELAKEPVIERGKAEEFDSVDLLNPSVIMWDNQYYNYYSGWDGEVWRTGLAKSSDGKIWEKEKEPVLDVRADQYDNSYIAANGSAVVYKDKVYYYYQAINQGTGLPVVGLAISSDGKTFEERLNTPVLEGGAEGTFDEKGVADPYVIEFCGKLYMYYLGVDRFGTQRLNLAVSEDGVNWMENAEGPIMDVGVQGAFDENGLGEPSVIYQAPYFYMLYTGRDKEENRNIGLAVSLDGVHFRKCNYEGLFDLSKSTWADKVMCDTTLMALPDGRTAVWFGGGNVASPDENLNGMNGYFEISLPGAGELNGFNLISDFDEAGCLSGTNILSTDIFKGSYEIEESDGNKYVWMKDVATIVLKAKKDNSRIIVQGYLPVSIHRQIGVEEVSVEIEINGKEVFTQTYTEDELLDWNIEIPDDCGDYIELTVKASSYVNNKMHGLSEDERNLSWMLNGITME